MKSINGLVLIGIAGAAAMTLLMGCGSASGAGSSAGVKVLYCDSDLDDTFRASLCEAVQSAASSAGVSVNVEITGGAVQDQIDMIASAKAAGYDAIIARLIDPSTALQAEVAADGLPMVFVNNQPSSDRLKDDQYVFVGSDENQAGEFQVEYVLSKLGKPSTLNVVIIEGEKGHSATKGRTQAVKYSLADAGVNANYVFVDYANWSTEEAEEKLNLFFRTGQDVDVVFSNNDSMALGAVEALKRHGLSLSEIPVCGVDATVDGRASIKAGEMQFTVLQDAKAQGEAAVKAAARLGNGASIDEVEGASEDGKYIWVPFTPVTSANVNSIN